MMKKGFTLAEVLITIAVIGVIAALSMPALISSFESHRVGPTLSKAVGTFAVATENLLVQNDTDTISAFGTAGFGTELANFLKIHKVDKAGVPTYSKFVASSKNDTNTTYTITVNAPKSGNTDAVTNGYDVYLSDGDIMYFIKFDGSTSAVDTTNFSDIPSNQKIGDVYIDINGVQNPNTQARDLFRFYLYNDGTLRAYGAKDWDRTTEKDKSYWATKCPAKVTTGNDADYCTGSIFDQGMKIKYKR